MAKRAVSVEGRMRLIWSTKRSLRLSMMSLVDMCSGEMNESGPKQAHKAFLLKMFISRQSVANAVFTHQHEAHGIAERVRFIHARAQQIQCGTMQGFVYPNDFNFRTVEQR